MKTATKTEYLQMRIDEPLRQWLERAAKAEMRSISALVRYAVLVYLAERYPPMTEEPQKRSDSATSEA